MTTATKKTKPLQRRKASIDPLRVKPQTAADRCDVAYEEITRVVAEDVFTVIAPHGRGPGKPYWLFLDEVDAWAVGGKEGVRELRYKKGRLKRGQ